MRARARAVLGCVLLVASLSGCWFSGSSGDRPSTPDSGSQSVNATPAVTIGAVDFTEMLIVQQLYGQALTKAGYQVTYRTFPNREAYEAQLETGAVDVVPEYAATMAEFLNGRINGASATLVSSSDPTKTVAALSRLARRRGLTVLRPAPATNQNGFAVTKAFATQKKIGTLSQLAAGPAPVVLAATADCAQRPFCAPGLKRVYGLSVSKVLPLGFGTTAAKQAVLDGTASLALVGTTDGTLDQLGLQLLTDDRGLQLADNVVPIVNGDAAKDPRLPAALNPIAGVLTTGDLARLNEEVDGERRTVAGVAKAYLQEKKLI